MFNQLWITYLVLFIALSSCAFPNANETPALTNVSNHDQLGVVARQTHTPFTTVVTRAKADDVLDHLKEAIEEVQLEYDLVIIDLDFREELFKYLNRSFRGVRNITEDVDVALSKAVATEMIRHRVGDTEIVSSLISLMNGPGTPNKDDKESVLARVAKKDLVRRIIKGETEPPSPSLTRQVDLIYQVVEKSRDTLLSSIDDWKCHCGGDCCLCPWSDPEEEWQRSKNASNPKALYFACICTCCPCGGSSPNPYVPSVPFPPKFANPFSLLCGLLRLGVCPW